MTHVPPLTCANSLLDRLGQVSDVHKRGDVDRELEQHRKKDVEVEDVAEGSFAAELLDGLGTRDTQEANAHEHTGDGDLVVAKLDTVEVLDRERVGRDETVERQDFVHLNRGDKRASTLSDDVGD